MFWFYNDLDALKQGDQKIKRNFKHEIVHPYEIYGCGTSIDDMRQIEVTLLICTLWKGVPHGLAIIQYKDLLFPVNSFTGIGLFNHGKLHNTSFTCLREDGEGYSFSKMQNGRPADGSYYTRFNEDGYSNYKDPNETQDDVPVWSFYSGQTGKDMRYHG